MEFGALATLIFTGMIVISTQLWSARNVKQTASRDYVQSLEKRVGDQADQIKTMAAEIREMRVSLAAEREEKFSLQEQLIRALSGKGASL
mgnify:FL=1